MAWKQYNFGGTEVADMMLGMSEEVGEMAHWYLKGKQGIRGITTSQAKEKMADAFADTVIFGIQAMSGIGLNAEDILEKVLVEVLARDWKNNPDGSGFSQHKK